jgi:hypothetical protein
MASPPRWAATLQAARNEAVLAVRLYNDPAEVRAFEGFVVHMHMAWLYLLHTRFIRDGVDYRYPDRDHPRRYIKVDGEYKRWELGRCVEERWPDANNPVRKNLEFFIGLRNRIEHRHGRRDANLAAAIGGHAQALLLNFEDELTTEFGNRQSLATVLRFPVFIGTFTTEGTEALRKLRSKLSASLKSYIAEFQADLDDETADDLRFELRLRVVLEQVQRGADVPAIQFTRWDDMTDEERQVVADIGKRGHAVVREQKRAVVSHGLMRPGEARKRVAAAELVQQHPAGDPVRAQTVQDRTAEAAPRCEGGIGVERVPISALQVHEQPFPASRPEEGFKADGWRHTSRANRREVLPV